MNWTKLPPVQKSGVHKGCLCCPTPSVVASLEKQIAVGFGAAECTKDGDLVYDDWRVVFHGPLHGETYQRHMENTWVMIESNMGFA